MQTIHIELNKNQFLKSLRKLNERDKLEIYEELKKSLFPKRFDRLLKTTRTDELSWEDISDAVEEVRQKRYEERKQILESHY